MIILNKDMTISNETKRRIPRVNDSYIPGSTKTSDFPVAVWEEYNSGIPIVGVHKEIYHDLKNFPTKMPVDYTYPFEYHSEQAMIIDRDIQAAPLFDRLRNPASAISGLVTRGTDQGFIPATPEKGGYTGDWFSPNQRFDPNNKPAAGKPPTDAPKGGGGTKTGAPLPQPAPKPTPT